MSQSLYVAKEKFRAPKIKFPEPRKSKAVDATVTILIIFGIVCTILAMVSLSLLAATAAAASFVGWVLVAVARKRIHEKDKQAYLATLEKEWMESESFIQMRNFIMLLGFNPSTAFEVTSNLGSDVLSNRGYSEANGYYMLDSGDGSKAMSAVQIATQLSAKNNIKVTAKILQEV